MRLPTTILALLIFFATSPWLSPASWAQGAHQGGGIWGQPLFMGNMPAGEVTVKVVGSSLADAKVGVTVQMNQVAGELKMLGEEKTGADGRATFKGLVAGSSYQAVAIDGERKVRTAIFKAPPKGGVRFLLSTSRRGAAHAAAASGGQSGAARLKPAADLPDGTIRVEVVRGKKRTPVAKTEVLAELKTPKITQTDANGRVDLKISDADQTFKIVVHYNGMKYRSEPIQRPAKGGAEVTFQVFDFTADRSVLRFGAGSHLLAAISERRIGFRQVLNLSNTSDKIFTLGKGRSLELPLPLNAKRPEIMPRDKEMLGVVGGNKIVIKGPIPPGRVSLQYFYDIEYQEGSVAFDEPFGVAAASMVFIVTNRDDLTISGPSVRGSRSETMTSGKTAVIHTLAPVAAGGTLQFSISNLPHNDQRPLMVTVALASLIFLWAIVATIRAGGSPTDLSAARRDELLETLVTLEREHEKKPATKPGAAEDETEQDASEGDAAYQKRRQALLRELRAIWAKKSSEEGS